MKQNRKVPKPPRDLRAVIHKKPTVFAVYLILRIVVLLTLVSSIIRGEYENAFVCLLVLFLFMLPLFIQQNFGIELPSTLEIIILLFIFASEILGELGCFFITYPNWDSILHTTTGFLCAATGFALIDILNRNSKIKFELSPVYVSLVAFCFSMTIGVLWEFFEFSMDRLFLMDMQKDTIIHSITSVMLDPTNMNIPVTIGDITSVAVNGQELGFGGYLDIGLYDTMEDLFVNFIGALVFSFIGYFYIKRRGEGKIAKAFIPPLPSPNRRKDLLKYRLRPRRKNKGRLTAALPGKGRHHIRRGSHSLRGRCHRRSHPRRKGARHSNCPLARSGRAAPRSDGWAHRRPPASPAGRPSA
ncbi:MAG: hypothetical protein ACLUNX_08200 [Angelakisella sp.]